MTKYRVKAYFMHEHERTAAEQAVASDIIQSAEWTPGYVMGVVDKREIGRLAKRGLIVTPVEEIVVPARATKALATVSAFATIPVNAPVATLPKAGRRRTLPMTEPKSSAQQKIASIDPRRTQYYIVRFHGPITKERGAELKRAKIKLTERLTRNKYTVRLMPAQVRRLAELPFVDVVRLYTEADTLRSEPRQAAGVVSKAKRRPQRTSLYAVEVHEATDLPYVANWLRRRKHRLLARGRSVVKVAMAEGSKIVRDLAKLPEVAAIDRIEPARLFDTNARRLLRIEEATMPPLGLEGDGEIVGIADTGIDDSHPDLKKRIAGKSAWGRPNDTSDPEGHGTHVAGCVAGDGSASGGQVRGAAPRAKLFFQSILDANRRLGGLPADLGRLFKEAYDNGARIHNNSWGAFSYARYAATSLDVDRFIAKNPDMLVVIAAGNDGIGTPRAANAFMAAKKGFVDWPCVAAPATAKNAISVGASRNSRRTGGYASLTWGDAWGDRYPAAPIAKETISGDDQCLAAFSSRGPSDDQRIKPDVVAPGTDIAAAKSKDAPLHKFWGAYPQNDKYGFMGGTSMAAPYVAGCAALVRQWYRKKAKWPEPSAALLKATLVNGTRRMTGPDAVAEINGDPNFHQGFGRIDVANSIPNPISPRLQLAFDDSWKSATGALRQTGQTFRYRIKVGGGLPLRICLAWTDPPARGLQNSLVLLVDDGSQKKWIGNANVASLLKIAGAMPDPNNNVQIVRAPEPAAADYTIAITASMLLMPPQAFALVVTGDLRSPLIRI